MSANGMRQFIVSSCLLLLLVTLLVQKPSSNTNGNDQGFFFVEAQSKPNNTKLYLFNEYHTASLAPNNLLYKKFSSNVLLTYEVECWNRPCDVFVIKSQQDYYNWRADYYNTTFASPNMYFYSRSYEKQIDYQTATDVVLVISNPKNATGTANIWYNYRTRDVPSTADGSLIGGIVGGIIGGLCLLLCCVGLIIWLCTLKANPKEYIPQHDLPREF